MIPEFERMVELVAKLPEPEQQALTRAFVGVMDAYLMGQQLAILHESGQTHGPLLMFRKTGEEK